MSVPVLAQLHNKKGQKIWAIPFEKTYLKLLILAFEVLDEICLKNCAFCQNLENCGAGTMYASCACRMHIAPSLWDEGQRLNVFVRRI